MAAAQLQHHIPHLPAMGCWRRLVLSLGHLRSTGADVGIDEGTQSSVSTADDGRAAASDGQHPATPTWKVHCHDCASPIVWGHWYQPIGGFFGLCGNCCNCFCGNPGDIVEPSTKMARVNDSSLPVESHTKKLAKRRQRQAKIADKRCAAATHTV